MLLRGNLFNLAADLIQIFNDPNNYTENMSHERVTTEECCGIMIGAALIQNLNEYHCKL